MKNYRNEKHGFEMNVPEEWLLSRWGKYQTATRKTIDFGCKYYEEFIMQILQLNTEPSHEQTENDFRREAQSSNYTELEFGRILIEDKEHVWVRYYSGRGTWNKKYFIVAPGIEYDIKATCFYKNKLLEREKIWDTVVTSFHLLSQIDVNREEPRAVGGKSSEAEYAIEHPLVGHKALRPADAKALDLYFESVRCHQNGNEQRALVLYLEATSLDTSLHQHAYEILSGMVQGCNAKDAGAIYYWLGIHSEYMSNWEQAAVWYEKAIFAFNQLNYQKRESRAHCNLGNVKIQMRDASAMDEFEKAIELNPKNGTAHLNIGRVYYGISDVGDYEYERALDAFANAILDDPLTYGPKVISYLREIGYTWKEDLDKITQRVEDLKR